MRCRLIQVRMLGIRPLRSCHTGPLVSVCRHVFAARGLPAAQGHNFRRAQHDAEAGTVDQLPGKPVHHVLLGVVQKVSFPGNTGNQ